MSIPQEIEWCVQENILSLDEVLSLNPFQYLRFVSLKIRSLITNNFITAQQVLNMDMEQHLSFLSEEIYDLILRKILTAEQVMSMRNAQRLNFSSAIIIKFILADILTVDCVIKMSIAQGLRFRELTDFYLAKIVKNEVISYLKRRANPVREFLFIDFINTLAEIERHGVAVIWSNIKDDVASKMHEKGLKDFYVDRQDARFLKLIDLGRGTELSPLPSFQKELTASIGYRRHILEVTIQSDRLHQSFFRPDNKPLEEDDSDESFDCGI